MLEPLSSDVTCMSCLWRCPPTPHNQRDGIGNKSQVEDVNSNVFHFLMCTGRVFCTCSQNSNIQADFFGKSVIIQATSVRRCQVVLFSVCVCIYWTCTDGISKGPQILMMQYGLGSWQKSQREQKTLTQLGQGKHVTFPGSPLTHQESMRDAYMHTHTHTYISKKSSAFHSSILRSAHCSGLECIQILTGSCISVCVNTQEVRILTYQSSQCLPDTQAPSSGQSEAGLLFV